MFSSRLPRDFHPNRLSRALEAKRREGTLVLDLTESNPTHAGFRYPSEIGNAFANERWLRYEPSPAGLWEAREAVAQYYAARGRSVEPDRILLTASTSEAYAYLFKLLTNPGDHVLVPRPSYPLFECLAAMESVEVRSYPLTYHGRWEIDLERLSAAVTAKTRAIILVSPNNPTGSYLKRAEYAHLAEICAARKIALIADEVFSDYAFGPDPERVPTIAGAADCLSFAMSGLSKVAGLPQMKMGWIVAGGSGLERAQAWENLEWIADAFLSVGAPVQSAAGRLLAAGQSVQQQIRERTRQNLDVIRRLLSGTSASPLGAEGGWYVILQMPRILSEEEWTLNLLERCQILTQPGFFYDFESEAFLVLSLLPEPSRFHEGLTRLARFLTEVGVK